MIVGIFFALVAGVIFAPWMLAAGDWYGTSHKMNTTGVSLTGSGGSFNRQLTIPPAHLMADYRRLSCPSCGRSYKYRGGLLRHIAECFADDDDVLLDAGGSANNDRNRPITVKDVRVLYKFWKH